MMDQPSRETLYEEVWSTPMIHLGKRYGMAGPDLRKLCVSLGIPIPENGHWSKVAAGQQIARPPLPPLPGSEATQVTASSPTPRRQPRKALPRVDRHEEVLAAPHASSTPTSEPALKPPTAALPIHPLIQPLVDIYDKAAMEALQLKAKHEWEVLHPNRPYRGPAPRWGAWKYFCDQGQVLAPTHKKSVLRVSLQTYKRALRILNRLAIELEQAGYVLSFAERRERLIAKRDDATIEVRIAEKLEAGTRFDRINSATKEREHVRTLAPTERLTLGIEQMGIGESVINESSSETLEDRWDKVLAAAEYRHQRSLVQQAEWKRWESERQEAAKRREEEERIREEARRREEAERVKREALLNEARGWQSSQLLRTYVAHLDARRTAGGVASQDFDAWRVWALDVADSLDKSSARVSDPRIDAQA